MPTVPTSIRIARLPQQPAHKSDLRCPTEPIAFEALDTVNVETGPKSTFPVVTAFEIIAYQMLRCIDDDTMRYDAAKRQFRPTIRLQPDTARYWSRDAWGNRAVVGDERYHVLFTTSSSSSDEGEVTENRHMKGKVSGDVFVLRLSEERDADGRRFYVDLEEEDRGYRLWEYLAGMVERFVESRGVLI